SVVNLGGVRIAKDPKGLDPMTPTYPIPTLGGLALDPGTVEIMANQARVLQRDVERGPFIVEGSPLSAGANQAQVVVRDRFGLEAVVSDQRYYIAPTLLRPGLTTWDVAVGQVREDENRYGKTGASASLAWGASDHWTLRTNAQADGEGNSNLALGATTTLGTLGTLDLELGRSSGGGRRVAAAYDYRGPTFGVRLEHERNEDYWRLRPERAADVHERTRASLFWRPSRDLSLRAGYTDLTTDRARVTFADVGVNWRKGPHQVGASVLRDIGRGDTRVEAGYTYAFGANRVGVRARSAPDADAWALRYSGRPTVGDTPVSVAAEVERGERGNQVRAAASWNTDTGMARLDAGTGHG
ncbi:MAG: fimbria/pilus outer membrane usher protein, partial [Phycisphaerales bacterium]